MGHNRVFLKSDRGPAVTDLHETTKDDRANAIEGVLVHVESIRGVEDEIETRPTPMVFWNSPMGGFNQTVLLNMSSNAFKDKYEQSQQHLKNQCGAICLLTPRYGNGW